MIVVLVLLLLSVGCDAPAPRQDTLTVHVLDVGYGDCILLTQGEAAMLVDAGGAAYADKLVSYLHTHGVTQLDYVLETHPHPEHIGGMGQVVRNYAIENYLHITLPVRFAEDTVMTQRLQASLADSDADVQDVSGGMTFMLGGATVEIYPALKYYETADDYAAVCRVTYGEERVLLMSDAGDDSMRALMASGRDIASDTVLLGNHGGAAQETAAFLEAVGAHTALISCDGGTTHPAPETLTVLQERGVTVLRTDLHGDIVTEFDGKAE